MEIFSTINISKNPLSKESQEKLVLDTFLEEYQKTRVLSFIKHNTKSSPDFIFSFSEGILGIELFELYPYHDSEALEDKITNLCYQYFQIRENQKKYLGIYIWILFHRSTQLLTEVQVYWKNKKIKNPYNQCAKELFELVEKHYVNFISYKGEVYQIKVIEEEQKALFGLSKFIVISKGQENDIRKSSGKADPLILAGTSTLFNDLDLRVAISKQVMNKIKKKSKWENINKSLLLAHDLPRQQKYQGFPFEWEKRLREINISLVISNYFDEFWLVTYERIKPYTVQIF